nr:hypothetical protein [Knoellia sp. DB2414S]
MGAQASYLKASTGPIKSVGDGIGTFVQYQGGKIVTTRAHGTRAVYSWIDSKWQAMGGPLGAMGYPTSDQITGLRDGGWIQIFQRGCVTDSAGTTTQVVYDIRWTKWQAEGREKGLLGYPTGACAFNLRDSGWLQPFQGGAITDSASTTTQVVHNIRYTRWVQAGRENGSLGYPTGACAFNLRDSGWLQLFQGGAITDSASTSTQLVLGVMATAWAAASRQQGVLAYPVAGEVVESRGRHQVFQGGELWALGSGPARRVVGAVLAQWKSAGGATGRYGYPLTDTTSTADGRLTCTFEGGTIVA